MRLQVDIIVLEHIHALCEDWEEMSLLDGVVNGEA